MFQNDFARIQTHIQKRLSPRGSRESWIEYYQSQIQAGQRRIQLARDGTWGPVYSPKPGDRWFDVEQSHIETYQAVISWLQSL